MYWFESGTARRIAWRFSRLSAVLATAGLMTLPAALPTWAAQELDQPIYNPATKSYFALVEKPSYLKYMQWGVARDEASKKRYQGVRGRLAVINSQETHDFLRHHFRLSSETWIGLTYWCKFRKLQWVNGELHPRNEFEVWERPWYRNQHITCGNQRMAYMGVYYLPEFVWQASGIAKSFNYYFIEYPTGHE